MEFIKIWLPDFGYTESEPTARMIDSIEMDWQEAAFRSAMKHESEINVGDTVIVMMSVNSGKSYDRFAFGVTKTEEHYKTEYLGSGSIR